MAISQEEPPLIQLKDSFLGHPTPVVLVKLLKLPFERVDHARHSLGATARILRRFLTVVWIGTSFEGDYALARSDRWNVVVKVEIRVPTERVEALGTRHAHIARHTWTT